MKEKVQQIIEKIRPALQRDGGDIELVDIVEGVVKVRLKGMCAGCPMSQLTIANYVQKTIKDQMPEIKKVEAVT